MEIVGKNLPIPSGSITLESLVVQQTVADLFQVAKTVVAVRGLYRVFKYRLFKLPGCTHYLYGSG